MSRDDTNLSDWYDLALGEYAALRIKHNNARYYYEVTRAEISRHHANFMRLLFLTGSVVLPGINLLHTAVHTSAHVSAAAINAYGAAWNFGDTIGGADSAGSDFIEAINIKMAQSAIQKKQRKGLPLNSKEKFILNKKLKAKHYFAIVDQTASVGLAASTFATLAGCTPAGAIGFAVCMWTAFARSVHDTHTARKKMDPAYLLHDRMKKLKQAKALLAITAGNSAAHRKAEIAVQRLELQVDALFSENEHRINMAIVQTPGRSTPRFEENFLSEQERKNLYDDLKNRYDHHGYSYDTTRSLPISFKVPKAHKHHEVKYKRTLKVINRRMRKKQKAKFKKRMTESVIWGTAAVGMTLVAVGIFFPPAALAGAVIAAAAGVMKLAEVIHDHRHTLKEKFTPGKSKLQQAMDTYLTYKTAGFSEDAKREMAIDLFNEKNPSVNRSAYRQKLMMLANTSPKQYERLLKRAWRRSTENALIKQQLANEIGEVSPSDSLVQMAYDALNEHDRAEVLEKALADPNVIHQIKARLAARNTSTAGFFHKATDHLASPRSISSAGSTRSAGSSTALSGRSTPPSPRTPAAPGGPLPRGAGSRR